MQPLGENSVNTPAFLGKLWKMVNDPSTDHLICWSPAGNSFIIQNQAQFWYELLPLYYKHNNMSSFVRQLNMYGFHKISTVENGTMDAERDEIQFTHPFFQKEQPELLRNIKRKATNSKASIENNYKHDELAKVLTDVKQLRGRQLSVDNQLNAMKQENALLWREVAILRQKHLKQQKIVNKLIQFLVTLVQPSRMPVGVKRGYQLMLNESPTKKSKVAPTKSNNIDGPTIHELDSELDLSPNLVYDDEQPLIGSPTESQQQDVRSPLEAQVLADGNGENSPDSIWDDKQEYVTISNVNSPPEQFVLSDSMTDNMTEENLIDTLENGSPLSSGNKVFINPTTQDTLLSNLINSASSYPVVSIANVKDSGNASESRPAEENITNVQEQEKAADNMAVATRDTRGVKSELIDLPSTSIDYGPDHLSTHVETTESELEQLKDILNGYNTIDANALLGALNKKTRNYLYKDVNDLLNHDSPPSYDLMGDQKSDLLESGDPLVSGSELTPYSNNFDFTELFDDSLDGENNSATSSATLIDAVPTSTVNTPQIQKDEPIFPTFQKTKQ